MTNLDTASPEQLKAALDKSSGEQSANVAGGHTYETPSDFSGIEEPGAGDADSGMGRFSPLESDPEGGETVTDEGADMIAAVDEGDTPAVGRDPEEIAELRVRAEEYGIASDEIQGMRPSVLEKLLDRFDSHVDGIASAQRAAPDPTLIAAAAAGPAPADRPAAAKPEAITLSEEADPDLAVIAKAVNALTNQMATMQTTSASQQETNLTQQVNLQFEALVQRHGKAAANLFGASGKQRPAQRINRENVHKAISVQVQGHRAIGGVMPEAVDLFDTALRSSLGEKYAKLVSGAKDAAVAQRQTQHLQRPHSRAGGKPVSGAKKAVQSVARMMRERGMTEADVALSDEEEFATL